MAKTNSHDPKVMHLEKHLPDVNRAPHTEAIGEEDDDGKDKKNDNTQHENEVKRIDEREPVTQGASDENREQFFVRK